MTTAGRREPTFYSGQSGEDQYSVHLAPPVRGAVGTSHVTRVISGFQAISTLIGVPIALASGYTLYKANFAADTTCINLRASIVSMLDKNVDPATRRALVKRDIEAFEANCGTVDPDAHAAFKALLAVDKGVAQAAPAKVQPSPKPAAVVVAKEPAKTETLKAEAVKTETVKAELRPAIAESKSAEAKAVEAKAVEPKSVAPKPVLVAAPAGEGEETAPMSDARWLDAVRQALVEAPGEATEKPAEKAALVKAARNEPVLPNKPGEPVLQPNWNVAPPMHQGAAAPLPPPVAVNNIETVRSDPNRPVPPAPVPAAQYAHGNSWVAQIPFVGRMIDGRGD